MRPIAIHSLLLVATLVVAWVLMHAALLATENDHAKPIMIGVVSIAGLVGGLVATRLQPAAMPWASLASLAVALVAYQLCTRALWSIDGARDALQGSPFAWFVAQTPWSTMAGFVVVLMLSYVVANRIGARLTSS